MKRHIGDDRRRDDRRQGDIRSDSDVLNSKREAKRRGRKRRKFVRLAYPPTVAPEVLNTNFRIVDISQDVLVQRELDKSTSLLRDCLAFGKEVFLGIRKL